MRVSDAGIKLITRFEGFRSKAYQDSKGVWTIGYGHTKGVKRGQKITKEQALRYLAEDIAWVERCIRKYVRVTLTQEMFDALASFVFNVGCEAFRTSTLLKLLNRGNYEAAAKQFDRWIYIRYRKNGVRRKRKVRGLVRRRAAERRLFEAGIDKLMNNVAVTRIPSKVEEIEITPQENRTSAWKELVVFSNTFKAGVLQIVAGATAMVQAVKELGADNIYIGIGALVVLLGLFIIYRRYKDIKERF